jgi:hypothetical protein
VVVEDLIPGPVLDHLAVRLDFDAAHQVTSEQKYAERGVFGHGHLQMGLPRCAPWVAEEVVANPIMEQCAAAILGPCFLGFYNGNTNTPQSDQAQPMHADGDWVWKTEAEAAAAGRSWPPPATGVVMNFGVDDITEADGTEVWPGSHIDVRVPGRATRTGEQRGGLGTGLTLEEQYPEVVEDRRATNSPVRSTIPKGAVAIRDVRLWHRGMPSEGQLPRHMIALVYTAQYLHPDASDDDDVASAARAPGYKSFNPASLVFSESCRAAFDRPQAELASLVDRNVTFVPDELCAAHHAPHLLRH